MKFRYSFLVLFHLLFFINCWGLNGTDCPNYKKKNVRSGLWPTVNTMRILSHYLRAWSFLKSRIFPCTVHAIHVQICKQYCNNIRCFHVQILLYEMQTRSHEPLCNTLARSIITRNAVKHRVPALLCKFPLNVLIIALTHSIIVWSSKICP